MRKAKIFLINGVVLTSTSLLMRGVNLIFNIYVANMVGKETVGVFSLIMSFYLFAVTFATSGISTACTCIVSEELEKRNLYNVKRAFRTCMFFGLLLGIVSSVLVILFSPIVAKVLLKNMVSLAPILAISIGLPFIALSSVINLIFCIC